VKDLVSDEIILASTSSVGVHANDGSEEGDLSADGTRVAFFSYATNLHPRDHDSIRDVYVKDLTTDGIVLVSITSDGVKGNEASTGPDISGAGVVVAFESASVNLDPRDRNPDLDVYVKNLVTGKLDLASTSAVGIKGNSESTFPSISGDGRRVGFQSAATNLHPRDHDTNTDVFVKSLVNGSVFLASTSSLGIKGDGRSDLASLDREGGRVAFDSRATNLDPRDTDSAHDIYVKHAG
jgi:hypothetical protein